MEVRTKWIEELSEVIGRANDFLNEVCENYQWNVKELEKLAVRPNLNSEYIIYDDKVN